MQTTLPPSFRHQRHKLGSQHLHGGDFDIPLRGVQQLLQHDERQPIGLAASWACHDMHLRFALGSCSLDTNRWARGVVPFAQVFENLPSRLEANCSSASLISSVSRSRMM